LPPALSWGPAFEPPPRGRAPTQPAHDFFATRPLEPSLVLAPPVLAWAPGLFPDGLKPAAARHPGFAAFLTVVITGVETVTLDKWYRPADGPPPPPRLRQAPWHATSPEISLFLVPPVLSARTSFDLPPRGPSPSQPAQGAFALPWPGLPVPLAWAPGRETPVLPPVRVRFDTAVYVPFDVLRPELFPPSAAGRFSSAPWAPAAGGPFVPVVLTVLPYHLFFATTTLGQGVG
jgi:hypothetical protein